jgi:hypothetical protein
MCLLKYRKDFDEIYYWSPIQNVVRKISFLFATLYKGQTKINSMI